MYKSQTLYDIIHNVTDDKYYIVVEISTNGQIVQLLDEYIISTYVCNPDCYGMSLAEIIEEQKRKILKNKGFI